MKDIPAIPDRVDADLRHALVRMREELQFLIGTRGNDPAARLRQITNGLSGSGALVVLPGTGTGGGSGDAPDLTPPPTPTFADGDAFGGIAQVVVTWSGIGYTQGHGNKQTIVYAVKKATTDPTLPTFPGDAGIVAIAPHALTIIAIPSEPNTRWHIWLKFETNDGVQSNTPAGGTNGVVATTGQDVTHLLTILTGQIRESQLFSSLGNRINLIDAADTVAGSVAARVKAERDLRVAGDTATLSGANSYTATYAYPKADGEQLAISFTDLNAQVLNPVTGLSATRTTLLTSYVTIASQTSAISAASTSLRAYADTAAQTAGYNAQVDAQNYTNTYAYAKTAGEATAGTVNTLVAKVDTPNATSGTANYNPTYAALLNEVSVRTSLTDSLSTSVTRLVAQMDTPSATPGTSYNPTYAALQTEASARATLDGNVRALYTVRAEVSAGGRTVVGGFGLAGTAGGAEGPRIDFGVRADTFFVEAPNTGGNPTSKLAPFVIRTSTFTENGVSMPAGVYMNAAYMVELTAMYARIANLVADQIVAASISVAQLVSGSLAVGAYAQSTGYVSGSAGWRINGNGTAEFSGVVVRGAIFATAGSIGGNTIDSSGIKSPGFSSGSAGFRLDSSGAAEFNNITARGTVHASAGTIGAATINGTGVQSTDYVADTSGWRLDNALGKLFALAGKIGGWTIDALALRIGATGWLTDTGIWAGLHSGTPKAFIGNPSGPHAKWDGTDLFINTPTFEAFNASIAGGTVTHGGDSRTVTVTGGKSPYSYFWLVQATSGTTAPAFFVTGGATNTTSTTNTATVSAYANIDGSATAVLACLVRDGNGRTTMATVGVSFSFSSGSGGGPD